MSVPDELLGDELVTGELTEEERNRVAFEARATVCHYKRSTEDKHELYQMLGLAPYRRGRFVSYMFGRSRAS